MGTIKWRKQVKGKEKLKRCQMLMMMMLIKVYYGEETNNDHK